MTMEISIELRCSKCGSDLEATNHTKHTRLNIEPCAVCIESEIKKALEEIEPS